ncbi:MAG: hypothetical protein SFX18_19725 [Pirellulales bacterium]|nr:hypothetical protein [Pirellulales bacterium]
MQPSSLLDSPAAFRRAIYALLIGIAAAQWLGRIMAVNSLDVIGLERDLNNPSNLAKRVESTRKNWQSRGIPFSEEQLLATVKQSVQLQRPFLSGNDRSRWLTVRALVEGGTYEIDEYFQQPGWDSIDIVCKPNAAGELRFYSSKPPFMATVIAGQYWLLHKLTGWTLGDHPYELGRIMLITTNILPAVIAWWLLALLIDRWAISDWAKIALVAGLCFATMLTPFMIALNNHLWGAASAVYAIWCWQGLFLSGTQNTLPRMLWLAFWTGLWAGVCVTCELPAAAFLGLLLLLLLWQFGLRAALAATAGAVFVLAMTLGLNYLAIGTLKPAYAFGAGDARNSRLSAAADQNPDPAPDSAKTFKRDPAANPSSWAPLSVTAPNPANWYDYKYTRKIDGKEVKSYWLAPNNPIDQGEPHVGVYAFHALAGHHGLFSLTPLLLLTVPGLIIWLRHGTPEQRQFALLISAVSVICTGYFIFGMNQAQRNYGGNTTAFRWLLWLQPLWIIAAIPATDWLAGRRWGRFGFLVLLALSVFSASYPTWNPWVQPWLWNAMQYWGWPTMSLAA